MLECLHSKGFAENKNENVAKQVFYFFARTPAAAQGSTIPLSLHFIVLILKDLQKTKTKTW